MQAVMQNAATSTAQRCPNTGRRPATAASARAAAAAPWQQRQPTRAVAARARVELTDLEGATHHLEVPEDANILEVALDQGLDMPYDCKMGVCLRCASKLHSGEVDQPGGMISDDCMEQGYALMCVSYPKTDCVVQVIPEEELVDAVMNIV